MRDTGPTDRTKKKKEGTKKRPRKRELKGEKKKGHCGSRLLNLPGHKKGTWKAPLHKKGDPKTGCRREEGTGPGGVPVAEANRFFSR